MAVSRAVVGDAVSATTLHLQIAVESARLPDHRPGDALVVGRVVRVFRDDVGRVAVDAVVELAIGVFDEGDDLDASLLDGVAVIEVCASPGGDGVLYVADKHLVLLDAATAAPELVGIASSPSPSSSSSSSSSFQKRDLVFVVSMTAFAAVGIFCVGAALSILLP